jgi:hypothetical protein
MFKKLLTGLLVMSLTLSGVRPVNAAAAQRESAAPKSAMTLLAETMRTQLGKSLLSDVHSAQTATTAVPSAAVPTPALKPLVLARVQSAYTPSGLVSGTLTITYTAINRLLLDELTGVEIRVKLASGVSLVSGPAYLTLPDGSLSFALGEIGPADGASVAVVVQAPAAVGAIDDGAQASASFANKRVSAQTAPARLVADAFAPYLGQQPEFMFNDLDLLEVAGLVEQDPAQAFALVRDATHWEAYRGSLRGARGTWWSEAGNALDRASLLLGVLRTIGTPSRYVRGGLPDARQRELIRQMFGDTVSQMGAVPAEKQYDPYTDAKLLQAAGEHWWVEADLGGGWQALDANFKGAAIGQVFGAGGTPMTVIPDAERHWTKIALTVEHLPALTGPAGKLETFKPFELTLPTAQIAGVPTVIGHFVRSTFAGGAVFYNIRHYYTPFIAVGGIRPEATIYRGDEYFEQITNFPLASQRVTAASFDVTIYGPDTPAQTYQDEIVDRIGKLARREGGTVNSAGLSSTAPVVEDKQSVSLFVAPMWVPERAVTRAAGRAQRQVLKAQAAAEVLKQALPGGVPQNEADEALIGALDGELASLGLDISIVNGFSAMQDADRATRQYAEAGRVQARYTAPRLLASALDLTYVETLTAPMKARMNLMRRDIALTPYPGQNPDAAYGVRMAHGIRAMTSEYLTLAASAGPQTSTVKSALGVMDAAMQQGIGYVLITPEQPEAVRQLAVSDDAKARMLATLERGRAVMAPGAAPTIGGQPYAAWLEMDLETGEVEDQDEYGKRAAIVEYMKMQRGWKTTKCGPGKDGKVECKDADTRYAFLGFISGFTARLYVYVLSRLTFVSFYLVNRDQPHLINYVHKACLAYRDAIGVSEGWGYAKGDCSAKEVANFFDALVWLTMSFIIRFYREGIGVDCSDKTLFGMLPGGTDEAYVFWSGLTLAGVKFWRNKCAEFAAKIGTFAYRSQADLFAMLFNANSIDPFKQIVDGFLPWLVGIFGGGEEAELAASFGMTFVSYDVSGVKLRAGGFDQGAAVAGLLLGKILLKDPDVPPGVTFNVAAPPARPLEVTRLVTPAATLGPSASGALSTAHTRLRHLGAVTVTNGALAIAGGQIAFPNARLLDAGGAPVHTGDLSVQLSSQGGRLTLAGPARLSGAADMALWSDGGALVGQAVLTDAHRLTIQATTPLTLWVGAGAVINGATRAQPMQIVFTNADWRKAGRVAWLGSSAVAWSGPVAAMQIGAMSGALGDVSDAAAVSVLNWSGTGQATPGAGGIALSLNGVGGRVLSAAPAWTASGDWWRLQPDLRSNQTLTWTLGAQVDAGRFAYEFEPQDGTDILRARRQPDQVSADTLGGSLFLRDSDNRTALLAEAQTALPARAPALAVSVAPDELNKPIWGEFPYYGVMGLLYHAQITYTAATSGVFNLAVSGFPAGWASLSRDQVTLEKGQSLGVGIVVSPPLGAMPLPGTTIPFTVTVTQVNGGLWAAGSAVWRAPETGLPGVMFDPNVRTEVAPTETVVAGLYVFNGGTITDTFSLSTTTNVMNGVTITAPASVTVGADDVARVPVTVTFDAEPGRLIPIAGIAGPPGLYTRTAMTHQRFAIVPVEDIPLYERAYALRGPGCKARLAHATYLLAQQMSFYRLGKVSLAEVEAAKARLNSVLPCFDEAGVFTGTQAISTALTLAPTSTQPLVDALDLLSEQVERALDYRATLSIAPALSVARVGQPVALPVVLEHTGRVSGTFTLTVTDTDGVAQIFMPTLAPGERFTHTVVFTPSVEGTYAVTATASTPDPQVRPRARATVLAYERLTDILVVRGTPDFVETGNSSSALSVDVVNHTPLPQPVTIQLTMTEPGGGVYYTAQVTRTLMRGVTNIPLGTVPFVNAPAGVYALEARLVEENRVARGGVNAGTGVRVATSSRPLIVPPGDVEATTWITTERTVYGSGGTFEVGVPISGGVDLTITLDAAQHSGTNPAVGVAVTVPAGIYDAVYITGAVRWHDGGQWYGQVDILDTLNNKYYMLGHAANTSLGSFHPFVGGLPTMEAAGAYHAGRFIRLRITDTTTLRFYIYDTNTSGSSANVGTIIVRLTQVDYPDNTLRRRMEAAMHHAAPRHALDAIQWDTWTSASTDAHPGTLNKRCNGCHIQAQGISGLAALNTKLRPSPVDERMMEWLSTWRLQQDWQDSSGRVTGYHSHHFIMTALAAWAWAEHLRMETNLGRTPNVTLTNALLRAVNWSVTRLRVSDVWQTDHNNLPWLNTTSRCAGGFTFSPMATYYLMTALRTSYDLTGDTAHLGHLTNAAMTLATQVNWRGTCGGERYPYFAAPAMLALQEAVSVITDTTQVQTVRNAIQAFEMDLRHTQQLTPATTANDGGWRIHNAHHSPSNPSDPLVTSMALYALARQGVRSTDINLMRATEFLLSKQDRTGRWYSIYASNPIMSTTWVDFALPLVYEAIGSYSLDVLHDTPLGVDVLDDTFNLAPQSVVTLPVGERRAWFYNQPETMRYQVISYTSVLTGLRPGEVRPLTLGTLVTYIIESGSNQIALPGAYVQAVKLVSVAPAQQVIGVGQTARYTITLRNPLDQPVVYAVAVSGLDAYGADQTFSVNVPANGQVERVIEVSAPEWMQPRQDAFWVTVNGGQDSDVASLRVVRETALRLLPASQRALPGRTVTYTAVVSDLSGAGSIVDVVGQLGGGSAVTLANGLSVLANQARIVTWTLTAPSTPGTYGLRAHALGGLNVPEASAQLEVVAPALSAALGSATVGAGMPAVLTSTLRQDAPAGVEPTLPGALVSVQAPAGWQVVQAPTHLPAGRSAGHGDVIVVPPAGTAPGTYNVMMTAVMTGYPQVTAQAVGRVTVLNNGLVVSVRPTTQTVTTGDAFEFEVLVINTGTAADQVVVSATGMLASHSTLVWDTGSGVVVANRVSLAPGQSARFVLAGQATNALVGGVHPAAVMARSLSRPEVQAVDYGWLIVNGRPDLRLTITPTYQLVETPNAGAWLRLDNAGSAAADPVVLTVATEGGAAAYAPVSPAPMVLPQWQGALPLSAWLPRPGRYVVTATASTPGMAGFAVATATVEYRMAAALRVAGVETWPGQSATLPFTLTNLGQQTMNNLSVRLSVPQGPWSLNGISAQNGPLTLTLPGGPVTPGENGRSYQVLPFAPLPYGAERITVTAELLLNGEVWQVEQAQVRVRAPDFRTSSLTVAGSQLFVHDILTYTWRLRNTGDADAIGAQAVVTLPEDTRFEFREVLSVSSGAVLWDGSNKRLIWQGDLPMGSEVVITFRAQASFGLPRSTLASPFEVTHTWRPTHTGQAQYDYPYRLYFMIVRRNAQ